MNKKFKLGLSLFFLGLIGILTMLTIPIPMESLPVEIKEKFSADVIKYLILINPTILLMISVIVGTVLYEKVGFSVPTISRILNNLEPNITFREQLKLGIFYGLLTGVILVILSIVFKSFLPYEFSALENGIQITAMSRIGYGGFTEEILMRFGLLTFIVWILFKITKNLKNNIYWTAILLTSFVFALGHFPVVFSYLSSPSMLFLGYIFVANSIAGMFFGWLYWKKGLEASFIGHIFAHILMLLYENIF